VFHVIRPEANGVVYPPLRARADTESEAMTDARIAVILDIGARPLQCRNASLHNGWMRDPVGPADGDEGRRLRYSEIRVIGVKQDDSRRPR
jgi:hypothetical protein